MTLSQVVESHCQPIDGSETISSLETKRGKLTAVLEQLIPAEMASRKHLVSELEKLDNMRLILNLQQQCDIKKLDMGFMRTCTRSAIRWMVPQFALVRVFAFTPEAVLTYGRFSRVECEPSQDFRGLYDVQRLESDIHTLWIFGRDKKRRISFTWQGTMPSRIRALANTAKDLVGKANVYLVVDTKGHWQCESFYKAPPADPLLVVKVGEGRGAQWFLLGQFDPTPMEQWVAAEMTEVV